jgi:hypothetical protein
MGELRVIRINTQWVNKMGEPEEEATQYLQEKIHRKFTWFGLLDDHYWRNIDSEHVPSFAWIHKSVFGDESNWKSKFRNIPNCKFYSCR